MTEARAPERRRRWLLLPSAVLLAAAVAPIDTGVDRDLWGAVGDALHAPLLAAVALMAVAAQRGDRAWPRRALIAAAIAVTVAVGVELGQPWVGRSASLVDAINGVLGAGAAIGGWLAWTRGGRAVRVAHLLGCVAMLVVVSSPAWLEWRAVRWRETNRPLLGDFEHPLESRLWHPIGVPNGTIARPAAGPATRGERSLEIITAPGGWSGVAYTAGNADWSGHRLLSFDLLNEQRSPIELKLRIDDEPAPSYYSRYNDAFVLEPGWNAISIPLDEIRDGPVDRPLELSRIRRMMFFVSPQTPSCRLRLDHVRLE